MKYRRAIAHATIGAAVLVSACSKGSQSETRTLPGAQLYAANCASCHQANGQGAAGAFPPLAASEVVTGDAARVIHIVKYGLTGAVVVGGKTHNAQMPAWSPQMTDANIASVITYVRSSWGNHAAAVTTAEVAAARP